MSLKKPLTALLLLNLSWLVSACGPGADPSRPDSFSGHEECLGANTSPREIMLPNDDGYSEALAWEARGTPNPSRGIVFVSGVDGGFIEPADEIYSRIARKYSNLGIPAVFVKYRSPGELTSSVADAIAAVNYLKKQGVKQVAILGWSFGGAVITHSTVRMPEISTAIGFAPQALDTEPVATFQKQSLLLFHSDADENVPYESSQQILDEAPAGIHKELVTISGADHLLTGQGDRIAPIVFEWLNRTLHVTSRCSE